MQIEITEHAIIRFLDRSRLIDLNKLKNAILTPEFKKTVRDLKGCGQISVGEINGIELVAIVHNYSVVTFFYADKTDSLEQPIKNSRPYKKRKR